MAYDIYKLSSQIETLATKCTESSAEELRQIAQKLEEAIEAILNPKTKFEKSKVEATMNDSKDAIEISNDAHEANKM